ncbi:hypothetical protein BOX15_Mlig011631g1 [Macrostomum lignano]|uniref:Uncharacterized protein n=1 Tax=Macrostomum lignano TaxID=282301 RepID=A0A267H9I2_9PLAT|nr:hypothetical protein BOX15_Mlig011631g1 [Macrostomum lignano]
MPIRVNPQDGTAGLSASLYLHLILGQLEQRIKQIPLSSENVASKFAYCIQTSGSTGQPKLVGVPDSCVASNIVCLADEVMRLKSNSRLLWSSPLDFDPSIVEIFCSRYAGCCLVVTADRMRPSSAVTSVTHLQTTPSQLMQLLDRGYFFNDINCQLQCLMLGGEPCPPLLALQPLLASFQRLGKHIDVVNLYGATELSVWASAHRLEPGLDEVSVSLGQPLKDTWLRLVDSETGRPLAEIVDSSRGWILLDDAGKRISSFDSTIKAASSALLQGEIWMSRAGVRCWVASSADAVSDDGIWHRSGDLARLYPATGRLLFLGRIDRRVKRFGVLLCPEALDALLSAGLYPEFPTAMEAHSVAEPSTGFIVCLVRLLADSSGRFIATQQLALLAAIGQRADNYLPGGRRGLPDEVMVLAPETGFALTPNGKADLLATLRRERRRLELENSDSGIYDLAQSLWALHTGSVPTLSSSGAATFAQCGGDSLGAVRLAARLGLSSVADQIIGWTFNQLVNRAAMSKFSSGNDNPNPVAATNYVPSPKIESIVAWRLNLGSCVDSDAYVSSCKSSVFSAGFDGTVAAVSPVDGSVRWSRSLPAGGKVDCALTGSLDGGRLLIVVLDIDGRSQIDFLSQEDGSTQWCLDLPSRVRRAPRPVVWDADLLVVGCHDASLRAISLSRQAQVGTVIRLPPRSGPVADLVSIDGDSRGTLVACLSGRLLLLAWPAGEGLRWRVDLGSPCLHRPCLGLSSTVAIVGLADGKVASVAMSSGRILWRYSLDSAAPAPIVIASGLLVVACSNGRLHCLEPRSGQRLCSIHLNGPVVSEPLVVDDQLKSALLVITDTGGGVSLLRLCCDSRLNSQSLSAEGVPNSDKRSKKPSKAHSETRSKEPPIDVSDTRSKEPPIAHSDTRSKEPPIAHTDTRSKEPPIAHSDTRSQEPPITQSDTRSRESPIAHSKTRSKEPPITHSARAAQLDLKWSYSLPGPCFTTPVFFSDWQGRQVLLGCRDNFLYCLRLPHH